MNLNARYRDEMDPSRVLVPVKLEGSQAKCRVFFDGVLCGYAHAPIKLFCEHNSPIGYRLVSN